MKLEELFKIVFTKFKLVIRNNINIECKAISVWMMMRHGTRQPERTELEKMKSVVELGSAVVRAHEDRQGDMCAQVGVPVGAARKQYA